LYYPEIRSAQKYWQIKDSSIYESVFAQNTVVGIVWSTKVDYATWFGGKPRLLQRVFILNTKSLPLSNFGFLYFQMGVILSHFIILFFDIANVEYITCIQMLPFTPITEALLPRSWIQQTYPKLSTALTRSSPPLEEGKRRTHSLPPSLFIHLSTLYTSLNKYTHTHTFLLSFGLLS
jgi:endo-1,3(4)-beta-glucanase